MNISEIITLISQLFTNNQNPPHQQQQQSQPTDYTNQYWQLPNYDAPPIQESITQPNQPVQQTNNIQPTSNIDIQSLIKLITTILELLPKNKVEEPKQKEIYPSYISNLSRTDQFNHK